MGDLNKETIELGVTGKLDPSIKKIFSDLREQFSRGFSNPADAQRYVRAQISALEQVKNYRERTEQQMIRAALYSGKQYEKEQERLEKKRVADAKKAAKEREVADLNAVKAAIDSGKRLEAEERRAAAERKKDIRSQEREFLASLQRESRARREQHLLIKALLREEAAEKKRLAAMVYSVNAKQYLAPIGPNRYGDQGYAARGGSGSFTWNGGGGQMLPPPIGPPNSGNGGGSIGTLAGIRESLSFLTKMYGIITAIKAAWYSIRWVVDGAQSLIKMGLEFHDTIKDAQYSVTGLVASYGYIIDQTGKAIRETERWNAALYISNRVIEDLVVQSLSKTKAPFDALMRGLQEGFAPMMSARIKDVSAFVIRFQQVMASMRVKPQELGQEMRGLITGDSNERTSRIAAMLFKPWKMAGENVKKKIQELISNDKFEEWFFKQTENMGKAGEAMLGNLGGTVDKFKQRIQFALGPGTEELYKSLIATLDDLSSHFIRVGKDGKVWINQDFVDNTKAIAKAFGVLASSAADAVKAIAGSGGIISTLREFIHEFATDPIVVTIKTVREGINDLTSSPGSNGILSTDVFTAQYKVMGALAEKYTKMYAYIFGTPGWHDKGISAHENLFVSRPKPSILPRGVGNGPNILPVGPDTFYWRNSGNNKYAKPIGPERVYGPHPLPGHYDPYADQYRLGQNPDTKTAEELEKEKEAAKEAKAAAKKRAEDIKAAIKTLIDATANIRNELNTTIQAQLTSIPLMQDKGIEVREHIEATARATKDALDAQVRYNHEIELLGSNNSIVREYLRTVEALRDASSEISSEEMLKKFENQLADAAQFSKSPLWEKYGNGKPIWRNTQSEKDAKDQAKVYAIELKAAMKSYGVFTDTFGDLIGIAIRGGKGFGEAAANQLQKMIGQGSSGLMNSFFEMLAGVKEATWEEIDPETKQTVKRTGWTNRYGNRSLNKEEVTALGMNRGPGKAVANTIGFSQIAMGSYANAQAQYQGSVTSGIIGGAVSGASMGAGWASVYTAIVGAIVGGLSAAFAKAQARDQYKFGTFRISSGTAYGSSNSNMNAEEVKGWIADIQTTYNTFYNGYVKLMTKIPNAVLPEIQNIFAKFQDRPSANYLKHLQEWLQGTLPDEIMGYFKSGMEKAANSFGMTKDKFQNLFDSFNNLDPDQTLEMWATTFSALENFQKSVQFFSGFTLGASPNGKQRAAGKGRYQAWSVQRPILEQEMGQSFAQALADSDKDMFRFSEQLKNLVGEDAIRGAEELSRMMVDRMEQEKQFFRELITLSKAVKEDVKNIVRDWTAEGLKNADGSPDYMKQAEYWKAYGDELLAKMASAKTPTELEAIWAEYTEVISRVKELQSQLGPNNAEWVRKWAIDAIEKGGVLMEAAIKRLGSSIDEVNAKFMEKIMPVVNSFLGQVGTFTSGIGNIGGKLHDFSDRIDDTLPSLVAFKSILDEIYLGWSSNPARTGGTYGSAVVSNRYS